MFNKLTGTEKGYYIGASNIYGHNPKDLEYRFQRVAPIHVSPHDPDVVYQGSQFLHKTINDGLIWETISPDLTAFEADKQMASGSPITRDITGEEYYSTLYSIRESKLVKGLIWTGSNDGVISLTKDGGKTWNNITPSNLPKGGRVESIEPSQFNPAKAYIAVDRHLLGDSKPYLFKTTNYGESWELISKNDNGIPTDFTSRVLREDPVREGLLYAGTEYGVFVSFDDGASWRKFQQNLPVVPITDLKIFRGDIVISTMGRGFWILDNITSLRDSEVTQLKESPKLFKPDTTIRYRNPFASRSSFPKYPQTSVIIDYFIPEATKDKLKLEILDANNVPVATIVGDSTQLKSTTKVVEDMNLSQTFVFVNKKLSEKPGLNRFEWNLRQKGAWHKEKKHSYKYGPMVAPGSYTVKLTVGNQVLEETFEIIMDPRVAQEGISKADIETQLLLQTKVIELLSEARKLQADLEEEVEKLEGKKAKTKVARLEKVKAVLKQLKNDEGAYPQQMLVSQISYLLNMISRADQLPGQDAEQRYENLVSQLNLVKADSVE